MAYFKKFIGDDNQFYFSLCAPNGDGFLFSDGYPNPENCDASIESLRLHATLTECYERKARVNGTYYFLLKALNGKIIASSKSFDSPALLDSGIEWVKQYAPTAEADEYLQVAS